MASLVVAAITVAGCAQDDPPDWLGALDTTTTSTAAPRTTTTTAAGSTTTSAPPTTPVTELAVGDCVTGAPFTGDAGDEATDALLADCAGAHDGEVVGLVTYTDGPGAPYPGRDAVASFADGGCATAFEAYVGSPYGASDLQMVSLWPTEDSWSGGDREAVCVTFREGEPLTASVAGTAP